MGLDISGWGEAHVEHLTVLKSKNISLAALFISSGVRIILLVVRGSQITNTTFSAPKQKFVFFSFMISVPTSVWFNFLCKYTLQVQIDFNN